MGPLSHKRDYRIDVFRGLALVIIFIDHIPFTRFSHITLRNFGFTSAADIFVLLAGVAFALVHAPRLDRGAYGSVAGRVAKRMLTIYAAHILVMVTGFLLLLFAHRDVPLDLYIAAPKSSWAGLTLPSSVASGLSLIYQPPYFDILPLYVVLLLLAVPLLLLARVHWALAMAVSFAVWAWAEIFGVNFPSTRSAEGWYFDPLTWQVVFTAGLCIGLASLRGASLNRSLWLAALCVVFLMIALAVALPCRRYGTESGYCLDYIARIDPLADRQSLWRILNTLAWTYLIARFIPRDAGWLSNPLTNAAACLGRHSLPVFCVGTTLSLSARVFLADRELDLFTQAVLILFGIVVMVVTAYLLDRPKAPKWPRRREDPFTLTSARP